MLHGWVESYIDNVLVDPLFQRTFFYCGSLRLTLVRTGITLKSRLLLSHWLVLGHTKTEPTVQMTDQPIRGLISNEMARSLFTVTSFGISCYGLSLIKLCSLADIMRHCLGKTLCVVTILTAMICSPLKSAFLSVILRSLSKLTYQSETVVFFRSASSAVRYVKIQLHASIRLCVILFF